MKNSNSCCLTGVGILSMTIIGMALLLARCTYTSPINEAGREYRERIKTYENTEIQTMEDIYERLEVLDTHFSSPTFDKMQGGEKEEVQLSDVEILFGTPDNIIENVEMKFIDTVYQYYYDKQTVSFHKGLRGIDEYVIEDYHSILYTSESLDQLFIDAILNHQAILKHETDKIEQVNLERATKSIVIEEPTREIKQNGWRTWPYSPIQYFDDGSGDYAPDEYLLLQYKEENNEAILRVMERRYSETYLQFDSNEEAGRKQEAYFSYKDRLVAKEIDNIEEKITVGDLSNAFGDLSKLQYNFRTGILRIAWLSNHEATKEFSTEILLQNIETLDDINNFEVNNLDMSTIHLSNGRHSTYDFIGSR